MAIEILVGLQVDDDKAYHTYRELMTPILKRYGGDFGYDFLVSRVLRAKTDEPINRVFTIRFPNEEAKDLFFSNEDYLQIRNLHFDKAVSATTIIATYVLP